MAWEIRTELINQDTQLRKVFATRINGEDVKTFFVKAPMLTLEEKQKVWDNIWQQYQSSSKVEADSVAVEGKTNLEGKEVV